MLSIAEYTLEHGGGTFRVYRDFTSNGRVASFVPVEPTGGYSVALVPNDPNRQVSQGWPADIDALAYKVAADFPTAEYIGSWINQGIVYVDPVEIVEHMTRAFQLGRMRGQKAIYSFRDKGDITL